LYSATENKLISSVRRLVVLGGALFGTLSGAMDKQVSTALNLPARFSLTGGQVTVKAVHPFRVLVLKNERMSGDITISEGPQFPSVRMLARLSSTDFRHSSPAVASESAQILLAKANPEIIFTSEIADVRPGIRQGESEVSFSGQLSIAGTKVDCTIPAVCAISPDSLLCRFDLPLRLSELRLSLPAPLKIPFQDVVNIQGEWTGVRVAAQEATPVPPVEPEVSPEATKQEAGQ